MGKISEIKKRGENLQDKSSVSKMSTEAEEVETSEEFLKSLAEDKRFRKDVILPSLKRLKELDGLDGISLKAKSADDLEDLANKVAKKIIENEAEKDGIHFVLGLILKYEE